MHLVKPANYLQVMGTKLRVLTKIRKKKKSSFTDNYMFTQARDLYSWQCETEEVYIIEKYFLYMYKRNSP